MKRVNIKPFYVMHFISIIILVIILYYIYKYLTNLNKCKCVNSVNVTHIKYIEIYYIIVCIIIILVQSFIHINHLNNKSVDYIRNSISKNIVYILAAAVVYIIIRYIVDLYLIYNVAKIQSSASCDCATSWELYAIYLQTILAFIDVIGLTTILFTTTFNFTTIKLRL